MIKGVLKEYTDKLKYLELKIETAQKVERLSVENFPREYMDLLDGQPTCEFEIKSRNISRLIVRNKEIPLHKKRRDLELKENATSQNSLNKANLQNRKELGKTPSRKSFQQSSSLNSGQQKRYAKAPYNFVPINKEVVEADTPKALDCYSGYSGYIELSIENLTPLYIRDTYSLEEENKRNEHEKSKAEKSDGKWDNPDFFSPGGVKAIPGSSLRGMIRNLVEIVSFSRMEFLDDSELYKSVEYKEFKNMEKLIKKITATKGKDKKNHNHKFSAGYLYKKEKSYFIIPTKNEVNFTKKSGRQPFPFHWEENGSCVVVSGPAPNENEKTRDWLIAPPERNKTFINLSPRDLRDYTNDKLRKEDHDLLRLLQAEEQKPDSQRIVPCFYIEWENDGEKRVWFDYVGNFRPYELRVKDHIPPCHGEDKWDFATSIFGNTQHGGRVYFEDAIMTSDNGQYELSSLKALLTPNPAVLHMYLENGDLDVRKSKHWGIWLVEKKKEGLIRGHKLYWHRKTPETGNYGWTASHVDYNKNPSLYPRIMPIKEGCRFKGRIRFENLSDIELGALMFVLELPSDCAHKLGMGKPLGLGSVKIIPHLIITNRSSGNSSKPGRYGKLFQDSKWYLPEDETQIDFKKKFSEIVLKEIAAPTGSDPWENPRLKILQDMLYYNKQKMSDRKWLNTTEYMNNPGEFKNREILDSATGVLKSSGI